MSTEGWHRNRLRLHLANPPILQIALIHGGMKTGMLWCLTLNLFLWTCWPGSPTNSSWEEECLTGPCSIILPLNTVTSFKGKNGSVIWRIHFSYNVLSFIMKDIPSLSNRDLLEQLSLPRSSRSSVLLSYTQWKETQSFTLQKNKTLWPYFLVMLMRPGTYKLQKRKWIRQIPCLEGLSKRQLNALNRL